MDSTRRKSRSSKRLSSASTASTAEAELSRSAYVLQQTKSRTAQLETHQEHVSSETTSAVNDHGKRIIKTTTITESVSRKAKSGRNSENCAYVEDDWELRPKTDYTYAHTPSYCPPQFVETPKPPSPNMSRQRLRGGKSIEVTPISDSSESGRRIPSPAGTRSGLKYGVPAMFRQSHESGQQTRTYTDYLRPQREEENMEDIRQQLHYSQRQDPSLSHLWGLDQEDTPDSTPRGSSRYFYLFTWFLQTIVTTIIYPVAWIFKKDTEQEEMVASSLSEESGDEGDDDDDDDDEPQQPRMGFMASLLNQVICVFSFVFISLPLACGLSTIWAFRGSGTQEEEEEVEGEEEEGEQEVAEESRILSETVLSGSLDLTDDDDDDQKKNVLEESSFCEEIPEWMFWGMSSILITLPSAIWQTLTFVFKSDQDVTDMDDGYDEVDQIRIKSSERTWMQSVLFVLYSVFIGFPLVLANSAQNAIGFSSQNETVWNFFQDYVLFWPYFLFVAVPVYVGRFCINSVCSLFGTRQEISEEESKEMAESDDDEEEGVEEEVRGVVEKGILMQLLDLILAPFHAVLIKAPLMVGNCVISLFTRVSTTEVDDAEVEMETKESVFKKMITGLLLLPYLLIFTVPTGMGRLALRMMKGSSEEGEEEEEVVMVTEETEAEISDIEEERDVLVGSEVYADRVACMRWLLNAVNGILVVASFVLVTLPTGFGLYAWSFFAEPENEKSEYSDNEQSEYSDNEDEKSEAVMKEGKSTSEASLLQRIANFIVYLPYYLFISLPTQTVCGLSSVAVILFNALTKAVSRGWDLWWDVVIWVVTQPYYATRALIGVKDEMIDQEEETVKVRRRSTRSSMAAKTLAAGVLADSQKVEGAVLLEESDSGIDSSDEVDAVKSGSDKRCQSLLQKVSTCITWPFYFVVLSVPLRIGNIALVAIESAVDSVCSAGQQTGISIHQSVASTISADASVLAVTSRPRRKCGMCCILPLILLLPLFLIAALYAWSCGGFFLPLMIPLSNDPTIPPPCCTSPCAAPSQLGALPFSEAELESKIRTILAGYLGNSVKEKESEQSAQHAAFVQQQQLAFNAFKAEMESDVAEIVQKQINALSASLKSDNEVTQQQLAASVAAAKAEILHARSGSGDVSADAGRIDSLQASLAQLDDRQRDDSAKIAALYAQLDGVLAKSVAVAADLDTAQTRLLALNSKTNDDTTLLVAALEERLKALMGDVATLNAAHALLRNDTKACCQNETGLPILIQSAVAAEAAKFQVKKTHAGIAAGGLSEDRVMLLIQNALAIYEADKTGRVDYALESAGGSIISTRCTETYNRRTTEISLFGIPLWYATNSPRTVIQPDMQPGQCWAFKGTQGFLVIQLLTPIQPTAFSLEHIPKSLSPNGRIESAPKEFSVWGLIDENDAEGINLGNFSYQDNGETLQYFPVEETQTESYRYVELRITSNHGNPEYTCLYRFRVHGTPSYA